MKDLLSKKKQSYAAELGRQYRERSSSQLGNAEEPRWETTARSQMSSGHQQRTVIPTSDKKNDGGDDKKLRRKASIPSVLPFQNSPGIDAHKKRLDNFERRHASIQSLFVESKDKIREQI